MTEQMTGGEAIIRTLQSAGVDTVFGIPGAQIYPLFDAIHRANLRLVVPRHEQSAAYMAMGYAKSTGRTGVFSVVPGPGVLNASAALCTAMGTCAPVLGVTGQVPSDYLGHGRGHLHELPDQLGTLKTIIKDALHISSVSAAPAAMRAALNAVHGGRPGPVVMQMCWDTMASTDAVTVDELNIERHCPEIDPEAISAAADLMVAARRPLIMCGAGAQHAADEVKALAELLQAPVTGFRSGRGVVAEDHPLGINPVAARELWDEVDLLIGIGSRCEMPYMRWQGAMQYLRRPVGNEKLIRIDIDPRQMEIFRPDVGVVGDSAEACRQLIAVLESRVRPAAERVDEIAQARALAASAIEHIQPQTAYLKMIRDVMPRDGFFVPELCQAGFTSYTGAFPVLTPRTYVTEGYQGTLGFGFPTALGVKVANPDRVVVSITGDGGFMFGVQELMTAAENNIGLVTVLFNNGAYGNVLRDQQQRYGGRISGSRLATPDFVRLADSFGVTAHRVNSPESLKPVLERAVEANAPYLIEVVCPQGSETSPWSLIHMDRRPSQLAF